MLLVVAQAQLVALHTKALNYHTKRAYVLQSLEKLAYRLMSEQLTKQQTCCLAKELNPNEVINLLKKQQEGCFISDDKLTYIYLKEYLGQFNCLHSTVNGHIYSTKHWRLTIAALTSPHPFVLQLRFATLAPFSPEICKSTLMISPGILSWRYLT
ncbi:hypothetical protein [Legionella beliardensis]|nr:hypothetical protein [Legionella beliardensis]